MPNSRNRIGTKIRVASTEGLPHDLYDGRSCPMKTYGQATVPLLRSPVIPMRTINNVNPSTSSIINRYRHQKN